MILRRKDILRLNAAWLPFAAAASPGLPLPQLFRLSLFQISVGMAQVLLLGTLNRVMIVELSLAAVLVAAMIAIPVLVAPLRAALGHRSDTHRSAIGWKRIPYLWFGSLWQMGGLAVMPFALIVLSGDHIHDVPFAGEVLAALAFLMTGIGMHMTQTAGLALAADRASDDTRPRVVAVLYVMYLAGMGLSALVVGWLLRDYSPLTLIRVVQGCALVTLGLNLVALWRQENVRPMSAAERAAPRPSFREAWAALLRQGQAARLLAVVVVGTLAFNMQDVLLEPYGGQILGLSVGATTTLTAMWAAGALAGFVLAARRLGAGLDCHRLAARGLLWGVAAFAAVILSGPLGSPALFFAGAFCIGFGSGQFGVATLTAAMALASRGGAGAGLALGAWGAAQATAAGVSIFLGGGLHDLVDHLASAGHLGAIGDPILGYSVVYHLEIVLLFVALAILGPMVRLAPIHQRPATGPGKGLSLGEFPT